MGYSETTQEGKTHVTITSNEYDPNDPLDIQVNKLAAGIVTHIEGQSDGMPEPGKLVYVAGYAASDRQEFVSGDGEEGTEKANVVVIDVRVVFTDNLEMAAFIAKALEANKQPMPLKTMGFEFPVAMMETARQGAPVDNDGEEDYIQH